MRITTIAVALLVLLSTACGKASSSNDLRAVKDRACACKDKPCATEVGIKLSKAVLVGDFDEERANLATEAAHCLAAFGE
jgi:predicted outer membrane protein